MKDHLIRNIEIRDFKCFDNFKAEGFARVNLIGGKNNVGKTAFIEAGYISSSSNLRQLVDTLRSIKVRREILNIAQETVEVNIQSFIEQSKNIHVKTNMNILHFNLKDLDGAKVYFFEIGDKKVAINVNEFSFDFESKKNVYFIGNFGVSNNLIKHCYSSVQKKDAEYYVDSILNKFDSEIKTFKIIDEIPQCRYGETYLPVSELGDGVRHLISIISSLYSCEKGYLFIDEIENGIHYTMMDNIWKIILKLSKELNVQVFATTHSKECIESFNRVQLKLKNKESSYFELAKEKETNEIFMSALPPSQLEYELSHEGKFRGE